MSDKDRFVWSGSVPVRVPAHDMWDLMWRQQPSAAWLGPQACVDLRKNARWDLADEGGRWRSARVIRIAPGVRIVLAVEGRERWQLARETIVTIRVTPDQGEQAACVITIEEGDVPPALRAEVERFWRGCLARLSALAAAAYARRQSVRQAVIVFHGIGEQQPGETLRSLAESGVLGDPNQALRSWVKPDYYADLYDVRRLTIEASEDQPVTDVFECYWAHLIRDTTLEQLGAWLQHLLLRWPVPPPLLPWWIVTWVLASIGAVAALFSLAGTSIATAVAVAPWIGAAAAWLWRSAGQSLAVHYLGDAARYLRPHPANIAHRQAIREAGVTLLEKLHRSGRYDRVVVLGHSLGSVIAYDILTHAWTRMNTAHRSPGRPSFKELIAIERMAATNAADPNIQDAQHAAWRRLRANSQPWLVTDLVTVGSPLAYADYLLVNDALSFDRAKRERLLPTSPPVTERQKQPVANLRPARQRMTFNLSYREPVSGESKTFVVFHHGAPFAVTRWTNLYFKTRLAGLSGDIIGGRIGPRLGSWIKDVELPSPGFGSTHTKYWSLSLTDTTHLDALRAALKLAAKRELLELTRELPTPVLFAEGAGRARD
jgi:hypothetical protein